MKFFLTKFFVVFLITTNFTLAQTSLAYNLKVGDYFKVYQVAEQDIVQNMEDSKHEMKNLLEGDYTFVVKGVSDSMYDIQFKFDRFKMVSSSNLLGELFNINTNDSIAEDDIQGKIFAQLVKTELSMKMYKNGKIKSIQGSSLLIDRMINSAGDFDEFTKEVMKESIGKEFSNESLAKSFEQMTYIYPSHSVKEGDTWTNNFEGDLSSKNTWVLESLKDNQAHITGESTIIFKSSDADLDMNLTGDMTTDIMTSMSTGFVNIMKTTSFAKGSTLMRNMNDLKVPTTISSNISFKVENHVQ